MQDTELRKYSVGRNFKQFTQMGFVSAQHGSAAVTSALNWGMNKFLNNDALKDAAYKKWMGSDSDNYWDEEEGSYNTATLVLSLSLWGLFMLLQFLSMNNPWIEYLRELIPHGYGIHKFVFGTDEERREYATYNKAAKDGWYECCPAWTRPIPDDDRGLFTATSEHAWRSAAHAQFKAMSQKAVAEAQGAPPGAAEGKAGAAQGNGHHDGAVVVAVNQGNESAPVETLPSPGATSSVVQIASMDHVEELHPLPGTPHEAK